MDTETCLKCQEKGITVATLEARYAAWAAENPEPEDISPLTHSAEGMVLAALERGVDVEARFARWNEDELSEEDDW